MQTKVLPNTTVQLLVMTIGARSPARRLRGIGRRLAACAVAFAGIVGIIFIFDFSEVVLMSTVFIGFIGFMAAIAGYAYMMRCPYCGWNLGLKRSAAGTEYAAPGVPDICPSCRRDLTKNFDPLMPPGK